jgi:16S rRNA (uracil1498-N3)-methyltransferase
LIDLAGRRMRRFFIQPSEIPKPVPVIRGRDVLHIRKVLRLKTEDHIILLDGRGNEYEAAIQKIFDDHIQVKIIQKFMSYSEPPISIIVMQAFLKEKKMDMLVRSLTELGMSRWVPFFSEHSIPRPDAKRMSSRVERWNEIAKESLKQCRRTTSPEISQPVDFHQAIHTDSDADLKIIFWENEPCTLKKSPASETQQPSKIIIMLGPEGGFSQKEIESAKSSGFISASLGPRILRAETASLVSCVLIQYLYGDMG